MIVRQTSHRSSSGFTLVELLVVIAIIGILVALLLPAVQAARESARAAQCKNNIKQLGLALALHEEASNEYPAGAYWYDSDPSCGSSSNPCEDLRGTWITRILPYIDFSALYDAIDFNQPVDFQLLGDGTPIGSQEIPTIRCPSSEHPSPNATSSEFPDDDVYLTFKMSNYGASRGNTKQITNPSCHCATWNSFNGAIGDLAVAYPDFNPSLWRKFGGPFSRGSVGTKAKQATDGLSKTIFLGEVRPECSHNIARGWNYSNAGQGVVSTIMPINFDTCRMDGTDACQRWCNWSTELGFKSPHPGGAHFAMGDGSVQFINETIDLVTYNRLGGKSDGEVANLE
jgi:prepilin-type N-terminal cleavage/methylation domain-containing protein/prepilin-type processing-associated H-X9-DG protein